VFCNYGVGYVLWNRTCGRSVKVSPVVCSLHGLSEMCSKGGPVATIFVEEGDSVREYWERYRECNVTRCSNDSGSIGLGQGP